MPDTTPGDRDANLRWYWLHGPGAALIGWGTPHDYDRCVLHLSEHISPDFARRLCNVYHREATGFAPGREP